MGNGATITRQVTPVASFRSPERCIDAAAKVKAKGGTDAEAQAAMEAAFTGDEPERSVESLDADEKIEQAETDFAFRKYFEAIALTNGVKHPSMLTDEQLRDVACVRPREHVSFDDFRAATGL